MNLKLKSTFCKMITRLSIVLFLNTTILVNVSAQEIKKDIEQLLSTVVFIYDTKIQTQKIDGVDCEIYYRHPRNGLIPSTIIETGTGFIVSKDFDFYLVTAEHVAKNTSINANLIFSSPDDSPIKIPIKTLLTPVYYDTLNLKWIIHPTADVAVIPLNFDSLKDTIKFDFIPCEIIYNQLVAPLRQRNLTLVGYPLGLGVGNKISPISKTYKPASGLIDFPRFDNKKISTFFLVDDPSISGLSGGPVFALPQEFKLENDSGSIFIQSYWLLGLVHGSISDKVGAGYGAIVPSKFIFETIELAPSFNGIFIFKYANGSTWSDIAYKNGFPWRVLSNFDKTGKPQEMGSLKDGNGTRYIYDENSKLIEKIYYKNGIPVKHDRN